MIELPAPACVLWEAGIPNYANDTKANARETLVSVYRESTGRPEGPLFPDGSQFITLCAEQFPDKPLCELEQMLRLGMTPEQYVGVDWDGDIIERNRQRYPSLRFIQGAWLDALLEIEPLNPAFIHYDTTNQSDYDPAISKLASTMELCPEGCFIAANFVTKNPYSGEVSDIDCITAGLMKYLGAGLNVWTHCGEFSYVGDGCAAEMTYIMLLKDRQ